MSYLDDLKSLEALGTDPTKPTKEGFVGFVGRVGGGIAEINATAVTVATHGREESKACSWMLTLPEGELLTVYVPAVSLQRVRRDHPTLIGAEIAQGCGQCLYAIRPAEPRRTIARVLTGTKSKALTALATLPAFSQATMEHPANTSKARPKDEYSPLRS